MQATEPDHLRIKGDDEGINFRPSPNFKHMKKYLKSKFEEASNSIGGEQSSPPSGEEDSQPGSSASIGPTPATSNGLSPAPKIGAAPAPKSGSTPAQSTGPTPAPFIGPAPAPVAGPSAAPAMSASVQPPLPPHPPPPDQPVKVKREVEDEDYKEGEGSGSASAPAPASSTEKVMCRQFARGACTRGAACIYVHELILSQLPGIYTFCKNFQNSGCNYPKCKFVHASVFEKEYYYRTGYLPPHALAHLKEATPAPSQPPPQHPPPPADRAAAAAPDIPTSFPNPPPALGVASLGANGAGGAGGAGAGAGGAGSSPSAAVALAARLHLKRHWSDVDNAGVVREADAALMPPAAKCKSCDLTELRLQCNKSKTEKLRRSSQELRNKIAALNSKSNEMSAIVYSLIKHSVNNAAKPGPGMNFFNNFVNNSARIDKKEDLVDKLKRLLAANNRLSLGGSSARTHF